MLVLIINEIMNPSLSRISIPVSPGIHYLKKYCSLSVDISSFVDLAIGTAVSWLSAKLIIITGFDLPEIGIRISVVLLNGKYSGMLILFSTFIGFWLSEISSPSLY
jgi:hypothetical protein